MPEVSSKNRVAIEVDRALCYGIVSTQSPNVEAAKALAREMVAGYRRKGALPSGESAPLTAEA